MKLSARVAAPIVMLALGASLLPGPFADVKDLAARPILESSQIDLSSRGLIGRACQNCHSNNPAWPWYGYVAPVSWMLRRDVANARKFLNFSLWSEYGMEGQRQLLTAAAGQLELQTMPPSRYLALHPEARLTAAERNQLIEVLRAETSRLDRESERKKREKP